MTWTRISDDFIDRPEILELSNAAFRLDIHALVYCNRVLSDGRLPRRALPRIWEGDPSPLIDELIAAGRWWVDGDGYQLDWSEQEKAESVKRRRELNAQHQAAYRERRDLHMAGDHSKCTKNCPEKATKPLSKEITKGPGKDALSLPVPPGTREGIRVAGGCPHGHPPFPATPGYCEYGDRIEDAA